MTEEQLRTALQDLTLEQLWGYCDALELERPATKEAAINLLVAECPSCVENRLTRNPNFVVKYLNIKVPARTASAVGSKTSKPCLGCNK